MRGELPAVAEQTVAEIIVEVPSYAERSPATWARSSATPSSWRSAGSSNWRRRAAAPTPSTPIQPALEGAYELGRGEARSGRSMDALLAAYRVGARVSWRHMSATASRPG